VSQLGKGEKEVNPRKVKTKNLFGGPHSVLGKPKKKKQNSANDPGGPGKRQKGRIPPSLLFFLKEKTNMKKLLGEIRLAGRRRKKRVPPKKVHPEVGILTAGGQKKRIHKKRYAAAKEWLTENPPKWRGWEKNAKGARGTPRETTS